MKTCPHCKKDIAEEFDADVEENYVSNEELAENYTANEDIEDTTGLKNSLTGSREDHREAKRKVKMLQQELAIANHTGKDATELRKQLDAANVTIAESTPTIEALTADNVAKDITIGKQRAATKIGKATAMINAEKGNVEVMLPHVLNAIETDDDGNVTIKDQPDMKPEEFMKTFREKDSFAGAFKASTQSGSGSDPGKGGDGPSSLHRGARPANLRRGTMTDRQKIDFQKEFGLDRFMDLPI